MATDAKLRKKWIESFVRCLREGAKKIPEPQRSFLEWDYLLLTRQIEVIPIEGTQIHIFIATSFEDWQEEIVVHEACLPDKTLELMEKILSSPKWSRIITQDGLRKMLIIPPGKTYGDSLKYFLLGILQRLDHYRNWPENWEKGIDDVSRLPFLNVHGTAFLDGCFGSIVIGNIFELSPEAYAQKTIDFSTRSTPPEEGIKREPAEPAKLQGHGVYLYPPVWIGDPVNPSLSELWNRNYWPKYEETRLTTTYRGRMLLITAEGFLAIAETDRSKVAGLLNEIATMMLIRGIPSHAVREHEIWNATITPDTKKVVATGGQLGSPRSTLHDAKYEEYPPHISILRKLLSPDLLLTVIHDAERLLSQDPLKTMSPFLLESYTHYDDGEYPQSFIMSWIIHEKEIGRLWSKLLKEENITGKRLNLLENPTNWTTSHIFETLSLKGILPQEDYELLSRLNRKRNRVIHKGEAVSKEEAKEALDNARAIISKLM